MTAARPRNHFIAAPADSDPAKADQISPRFACSAAKLYDLMRAMALAQPRTELLSESPDEHHLVFVQRSKYWRFPDDIVVKIMAIEDGGATLSLASKARYGIEDFGVNRRRVKRWLAALERRLAS